jgi:hypothetical protein
VLVSRASNPTSTTTSTSSGTVTQLGFGGLAVVTQSSDIVRTYMQTPSMQCTHTSGSGSSTATLIQRGGATLTGATATVANWQSSTTVNGNGAFTWDETPGAGTFTYTPCMQFSNSGGSGSGTVNAGNFVVEVWR